MPSGTALEFSDDELREAIARSRSWRGVARVLGYSDRNGFIGERLRERASDLGIPTSHFPWHIPWTAPEVATALRECDTWTQVLLRLGVALGGHNVSKVRSYADRHGLDYSHFARHRDRGGEMPFNAERDPAHVRTAG